MSKTGDSDFAKGLKVATGIQKSHISLYEEYIDIQKNGFIDTINFIEEIIIDLIKRGEISPNTRIVARIKDIESALMNDKTVNTNDFLMRNLLNSIGENIKVEDGKKLDDSFGITIISVLENDQNKILETMNKICAGGKVIRSKEDKKIKESERNYSAIHSYLWVNLEHTATDKSPIIECKYMLEKDYIEAYDHTTYKVEHLIGRKLSEEEIMKVKNFIQDYYNHGKFTTSRNVPQMYESKYNPNRKRMELRQLSREEALKTVYPFLDTDISIQK